MAGSLYERFDNPVAQTPEHESRSAAAKDRDRIVHSGALRRLQRKSQIVGVQSNDFFRTRLTHTFECAQIGRGIARRVEKADWASVVEQREHLPDLVEAACLAHDLGHPPFGHNGEHALQAMMKKYASRLFEGNAQSFRIVTLLEPMHEAQDGSRWCGLNLTRTTLKGILKYPLVETVAMLHEERPKFCIYDADDDRAVFDWLFPAGEEPARTLATEILDTSDDIAYAVHDFEDGVWAGMIPLHLLVAQEPSTIGLLERKVAGDFGRRSVAAGVKRLLKPIRDEPWAQRPFDRSRSSRAALKTFCASLIGQFIDDITAGDTFVVPDDAVKRRRRLLTGMAWVWMIERPELATLQFGQRRLVEDLFQGYWENPEMLPMRERWEEVRSRGKTDDELRAGGDVWEAKARLICDHIAGMTDLFALHAHAEMYGGGANWNLRLV